MNPDSKSEGSVETEAALENLKAIKAGEDPRDSIQSDREIEIVESPKSRHDTIVRTREEINSHFVDAVNVVEPHNPYSERDYHSVPSFPLTKEDVKFSYCTSSGRFVAKCGARSNGHYASFSADKKAMGRMTEEVFWVTIVHELTHITEGKQTRGSAHNPTFWSQFAENCVEFVESDLCPSTLDLDLFVTHAREDPNSSMVDRRMLTVQEQKQRIEDQLRRNL